MPAVITNPKYTAVTAPTFSGNIANNTKRISAAVDNSGATIFDDFLVTIAASCPTFTGRVDLYLVPSVDGTTYADNATAGDATYSVAVPGNLIYLGSLTIESNTTRTSKPMSVAAACLGNPPMKFAFVIDNQQGGTLANFAITLTGVQYQAN